MPLTSSSSKGIQGEFICISLTPLFFSEKLQSSQKTEDLKYRIPKSDKMINTHPFVLTYRFVISRIKRPEGRSKRAFHPLLHQVILIIRLQHSWLGAGERNTVRVRDGP